MNKMNQQQREILEKILRIVGTGLVVTTAVTMPNIMVALAPFIRSKSRASDRAVYRILRYARRKRWIQVFESGKGIDIQLTKDGRTKLQSIQLNKPLPRIPWDGRWRLVIFDIPDSKKINRDVFRRTLRQLGFRQLQESVWITPYPCAQQLETARQLYSLGKDIRSITADKIEDEEELLAKFELTAR